MSFASQSDSAYPVPSYQRYWEVGEYRQLYHGLIEFMDCVLNTDQVAFEIRYGRSGTSAVRSPICYAGYRSLAGFFTDCHRWMDLYWPGYWYSPDFQLFFDCFLHSPFGRARSTEYGRLSPAAAVAHATLYNGFIDDLRREAVRRSVRKALSDWKANLDDQAGSVRQYVRGLQSKHESLLPLRIELYYGESVAIETDAMPRMSWRWCHLAGWAQVSSQELMSHSRIETRARIDPALAMQHRACFFSNQLGADHDLFDHMAGSICKLETGGRHHANHFHCLFLFDGQHIGPSNLDHLANLVRQRWWKVTGGSGLVFDCRERSDVERLRAQGRWALDPLNRGDVEQFTRFEQNVLSYFTEDKGQMLRVKPGLKARTLTKGGNALR